jgi:hypothetical protein
MGGTYSTNGKEKTGIEILSPKTCRQGLVRKGERFWEDNTMDIKEI